MFKRDDAPKVSFSFSTLVSVGLGIFLLASPGFYMSIGVLWFDIINLFNTHYDRQALGFSLSTHDMHPIFQVMGYVSGIGFLIILIGLTGILIQHSRARR